MEECPGKEGKEGEVLSTEDMMPKQGLASAWLGRRTRRRGRGGRRGGARVLAVVVEGVLRGMAECLLSKCVNGLRHDCMHVTE